MKKRILVSLVFILVSVVLFAGGQKESSSSAEEKFSSVFIPNIIGIEYYVPMVNGLKEAVEAAGGTFNYVGPSSPSVTEQIPYIKAQIQKGVDYLVFCPTSEDALNVTLDEAAKAGIKLITMNQDLTNNEKHRLAGVIPTDYNQCARDGFEMLASKMGYKGQFVVLSATTEAIFQNDQIAVYKEMLKSPKYKDMELVEIIYGNDDTEKSLNDSLAAFQKYPDLKGMIVPTALATAAAAQAIKTTGLSEQIVLIGVANPNAIREWIKEGTIDGAYFWDTEATGYVTGKLIEAIESGFEVTPGAEFDAGRYGKITVGKNNLIFAASTVLFEADNIDNYHY